MPARRMRCSGCGRACDNFSKDQAQALPSERLCLDCEGSQQQQAPPAPSAQEQQQQAYAEQDAQEEEERQYQAHLAAQQQAAEEDAAAQAEAERQAIAAEEAAAQQPEPEQQYQDEEPQAPQQLADAPQSQGESPRSGALKEGRYHHPDRTGYFAFSLNDGGSYYTQETPDGYVEYFGNFECFVDEESGPFSEIHWKKMINWSGPNDDDLDGQESEVDQKAELGIADRGLAVIMRDTKFYHESLDEQQ